MSCLFWRMRERTDSGSCFLIAGSVGGEGMSVGDEWYGRDKWARTFEESLFVEGAGLRLVG